VDVEPLRPLGEAGLGVADLLPAEARAVDWHLHCPTS
jgi:hypothetical protein